MTIKRKATNIKLARKCLALIRDIAARGADSENPEHIGYALEELSQVLLERDGVEEMRFVPIPATEIANLEDLYDELAFVDSCSQSLAAEDAVKSRRH
jgi:hypothetical protein